MARQVEFIYNPRPWQVKAYELMEGRRYAVLVAHRRAGKTEVIAVRLVFSAAALTRKHPEPLFGYVAPLYKQAKLICWPRLKHYAGQIPGTRILEGELAVRLINGSVIRLFGADNPDSLRGLGFDGVVMDEVAQMRPETWPEVIQPALSDRDGWAVFIGTPKGQNVFYEVAQKAMREEDWNFASFPASETGVFTPEKLGELARNMGENIFRQEYLCDFTAANTDAFIGFDLLEESAARPLVANHAAPLIFGLDPARFGEDRTVLLGRRALNIEFVEVWRGQDLMATAAKTAQAMRDKKPEAVFIDSCGLGAGVVDRLKELGHKVRGVNSGARAHQENKYLNLKAEMWDKVKEWLAEGGRVAGDQYGLRNDLLAPKYSFDHQGRLKIEAKDELKKRGLPSTDCADALALTFAMPVASQSFRAGRPRFAEM